MYTTEEIYQQSAGGPYRALVTYANTATGEIRVVIPSVLNATSELTISYIGRKEYNGTWSVPEVGSQIVVASDDANLSNIFWLQVNPDPATSLTGLQNQIDTNTTNISTNTTNISALTARVVKLETNQDALFLGVFR